MSEYRIPNAPAVYTIGAGNNLANNVEHNNMKKKKKSKIRFGLMLCLFIFFVFILFTSLSIVYEFFYVKKSSENVTICESDECLQVAAALKESMDTSVDPCDDFAKYACGKWSQTHLKPDTDSYYSWSSGIRYRQAATIRDLLRKDVTSICGTTRGKVPRAVIQVQKLYDSCTNTDAMNSRGLSPLLSLLKKLHLTQIPAAFTNESVSNIVKKLALVKRFLGKDVFFTVEVVSNLNNNSRNILAIGNSFRSSPFPIFSDRKMEKYLNDLLNFAHKDTNKTNTVNKNSGEMIYLRDTMREVISCNVKKNGECENSTEPSIYEDKIDEVAEEIYTIRRSLYQSRREVSNETFSNYYDYYYNIPEEYFMYVHDLQKATDAYVKSKSKKFRKREIWKPFIDELFKGILEPNWHTKYKLWVYNLKHLKKIAMLFATTDDSMLETITWWTVVQTVSPYSSKRLREIWSDYLDKALIVESKRARSMNCVFAINKLMGMATSWLYFEPSFEKEVTPIVADMFSNIKTAFSKLVTESKWMDPKSKKVVLKKNSRPLLTVGYPEWLFQEGELDKYYKNINLSSTEYLNNILKIIDNQNMMLMKTIDIETDKKKPIWSTDPITINAFHWYTKNQITITAGILQFPYFTTKLQYLNYGLLGATIVGHELSHGYDNDGRKYDPHGNIHQMWTNKTIAKYIKKANCYIKHYNKYYIEEADTYINGRLTLNENIADNEGLKEAFIAYKDWKAEHGNELQLPGFTNFTQEQLLFLCYAMTWCESTTPSFMKWMLTDSHAPNRIRVMATLRNSKEFSDSWQCPVGSYMNPKTKCELW